jgi:hypothetical protein
MVLTAACITSAGLIDWDGTLWDPGDLTNTYTDDATVTMTFSDDCDGYTSGDFLLPSDDFQGKGTTWFIYNEGLWWAAKQSTITLTITFDTPVTDVSFSIYDVDYWDTSEESIQIAGDNGGADVTPQVSVGSALSYDSGTQTVTADDGNVDLTTEAVAAPARTDILFENPVDAIVLTTSGTADQFGVIMGNLSYTVPEPATMVLLGLGGIFSVISRKRKTA